MKAVICAADELAKGHMRSAKLGPFPIVVVRAPDGSLFALLDKCLHQGGPLSRGRLGATPRDRRTLTTTASRGAVRSCAARGTGTNTTSGMGACSRTPRGTSARSRPARKTAKLLSRGE
jgi:hypothetical protein